MPKAAGGGRALRPCKPLSCLCRSQLPYPCASTDPIPPCWRKPPLWSGDTAITGMLLLHCSQWVEAGWGFSLLNPAGQRENICCGGHKARQGPAPAAPLLPLEPIAQPKADFLPPAPLCCLLHPSEVAASPLGMGKGLCRWVLGCSILSHHGEVRHGTGTGSVHRRVTGVSAWLWFPFLMAVLLRVVGT